MQAAFAFTCTRPSLFSSEITEGLDIFIESILLKHFDHSGFSLVDYDREDNPIWIHESEQRQTMIDGLANIEQCYLVDLNRVPSLGSILSDVFAVQAKALNAIGSIGLRQVHIVDVYNPQMKRGYATTNANYLNNLSLTQELDEYRDSQRIAFGITIQDQWLPMFDNIRFSLGDDITYIKGVDTLPCFCNNGLPLDAPNYITINYSRAFTPASLLIACYNEYIRFHRILEGFNFNGIFHFTATFK